MRRAVIVLLQAAVLVVGVHAGSEEREHAMTIRIHDYALVAPAVLAGTERLVAAYYAAIGARIDWVTTLRRRSIDDVPNVCDGREDLSVIVLTAQMASRKSLAPDIVGSAVI